jgi:hypothetical protein
VPHQDVHRVGAVRTVRVGVQVDAHDAGRVPSPEVNCHR